MFVLSIICNLHTVQVDYTNAFAQAPLNEEISIEVPKGFGSTTLDKDVVLKLNTSLYGLVQAPKTFYNHLASNLLQHGFECCVNIDSCLWINNKLSFVFRSELRRISVSAVIYGNFCRKHVLAPDLSWDSQVRVPY